MIQEKSGVNNRKRMDNKKVEALIKDAIKGDDHAFEKLMEAKSETILFTSLGILRNYHDAQDVAQEVAIRVYKHIKNLKEPAAFNVWLQRIIVNQCYSLGEKKSSKQETVDIEDMYEEIIEEDKEFLPQEFAETKEQRLRIREIVKALPEDRRLMVTMYYYEDLSYREISEIMDKSIGTVSSTISRAKNTIKGELGSEYGMPSERINKNTAAPVLSVVLAEQACEEIPKAAIEQFVSFTHTKVIGGVAANAGAALGSLKMIGISLLCAGVITGGTAVGVNVAQNEDVNTASAQPQTVTEQGIVSDVPKGEIKFVQESGLDPHVNPQGIKVADINQDYEKVTWKMVNRETKKEYTGEGILISKELETLYKNKLDGIYDVYFQINYPYGQLDLKIDFDIDTTKLDPTEINTDSTLDETNMDEEIGTDNQEQEVPPQESSEQ